MTTNEKLVANWSPRYINPCVESHRRPHGRSTACRRSQSRRRPPGHREGIDDNFASIAAAVEEGHGIYDNIRKTLQYLLAGNTDELLLMTLCVIIGLPTPLPPIHLLWINLVTDGLPAICLATDPIDPDVMRRHPRRRSESITDHC